MYNNRYGHMVHEYTVGRVRSILEERAERLEAVQTRAQAEAYVEDVRAKAARCFPALPARTDLNARITGTMDLGDICLEKVVYESRPGFLVSANLYLPKQFECRVAVRPRIVRTLRYGQSLWALPILCSRFGG